MSRPGPWPLAEWAGPAVWPSDLLGRVVGLGLGLGRGSSPLLPVLLPSDGPPAPPVRPGCPRFEVETLPLAWTGGRWLLLWLFSAGFAARSVWFQCLFFPFGGGRFRLGLVMGLGFVTVCNSVYGGMIHAATILSTEASIGLNDSALVRLNKGYDLFFGAFQNHRLEITC